MRSTSESVVRCAFIAVVAIAVYTPSVTAQSWGVEVAFDQSFTSLDEWDTPSGIAIAIGADLWKGVGIRLAYRAISEPGGEVSQVCTFTGGCTVGPFDQRYQIGATGLGVTKAVDLPSSFQLVVGFNASVFRQSHRLERLSNGERETRGRASDYGFGPSLALRFPHTVLGIRPMGYVRYDRVVGSACPADGTCYGDRSVRSIGVGVSWAR